MRRRTILVTLVLAVAVLGCEDKPSPAPEHAPGEPVPVKDSPTQPVELAPNLDDAAVRAVVDRWLAAQNTGALDDYLALYAPRFEGIKRVGPRKFRYDREGWAKDRTRMFEKKMQVSVEDLSLRASPNTATVRFTQSWASGKYHDVGPKRLLIVKTSDGLRIAREEMLSSTVVGSEHAAPPYDPQRFAMLIGSSVVLDPSPRHSWEKGPPKIETRPTSATRDVDLDASGFASWVGRTFELYGPQGKLCDAKIERIELLARVIPHDISVAVWDATPGLVDEGVKRSSDAYVAAEIWELASDGPDGNGIDLVGRLAADPSCKGALWAKPPESPARPLPARRLEGPRRREVVDAFTDLPGYHATQADFDAAGRKGPWHESDDARTVFSEFGPMVVGAAAAGYGCGDFEGGFYAFWRKLSPSGLVLASDDEHPWLFEFLPQAALQIGEDVYFVEPERVVARVGDRWELVYDVLAPNLSCGC